MYDPMMTAPMRDELTRIGVTSLETAEAVDQVLSQTDKTALVVVNSVCGCAAAMPPAMVTANVKPNPRIIAAPPLRRSAGWSDT